MPACLKMQGTVAVDVAVLDSLPRQARLPRGTISNRGPGSSGRQGKALQAGEHAVAQALAFALRETAAQVEGAAHFHHRQLGDAAHPFVAEIEAAAQLTERKLALRMKAVLAREDFQFAVVEFMQAGH